MKEYKLVFTGTVGAGKTTAISAISEHIPVSTDVANTDSSISKAATTVGLDYGTLTLDTGDRLRLFGTPGQGRFDFMWPILAKNALGLILLVDNSRPNPFEDLNLYLKGFAQFLHKLPCVVGIGRTETHTSPSLDDFSTYLAERDLVLPVLGVDVRHKDDVMLLIDVLLTQLETCEHLHLF